jgi:hypothetical protein
MQRQDLAEDKGKIHDAIPLILMGAFLPLRRKKKNSFPTPL